MGGSILGSVDGEGSMFLSLKRRKLLRSRIWSAWRKADGDVEQAVEVLKADLPTYGSFWFWFMTIAGIIQIAIKLFELWTLVYGEAAEVPVIPQFDEPPISLRNRDYRANETQEDWT